MSTLQRDLALPETWQKSLERSLRRRELAARGRKEVARRKGASAAMATAMMAGPAAPFASAAQGGGGATGGDTSAPASSGERQIEIRAGGLPLSYGYEGDLVAALQKGLGVESDGIFGPITEGAVKAFQRRAGLPVSGVVDPTTWQALFSGGASKGTASSSSTARSGPVVDLDAPGAAQRAVPAPKSTPAVASAPAKPRVPKASAEPRMRKASATSRPAVRPAKARARGGEREERRAPRPERRAAPKRHSSPELPRNVPAVDRGGSNEAPVPVSACGSSTLTKPVKGIKTSPFGPRGGRNHNGVDLAAPTGTAIRAVACGVISFRGVQGGYGNMVCIKHTSRFSTCYAHMSRYAGLSSKRVRAGQVIGYVGCSGNCTGPHLHFETRVDGRARNPETYLRGGGIPGRPTVKRASVRKAPVRKATVRRTTVKSSARPAPTSSQFSSAPRQPSAATASQSSGTSWGQKTAAPAPTATPVPQAPVTAPAARPAPAPVARQAPAATTPVAPQSEAPVAAAPKPAATPQSQAPAPAPQSGEPASDNAAETQGPAAAGPKVEAPEVEAPKVEVPRVEPPKIKAPEVQAPQVEAPTKPKAAEPVAPAVPASPAAPAAQASAQPAAAPQAPAAPAAP